MNPAHRNSLALKMFHECLKFHSHISREMSHFLTLENDEWFGLVTVALTFRGHQHFQIKEVLDFFVSRRQSRNSRSSSKERENTEKEKKRNVRVAESPTRLQSSAMVLFLTKRMNK